VVWNVYVGGLKDGLGGGLWGGLWGGLIDGLIESDSAVCVLLIEAGFNACRWICKWIWNVYVAWYVDGFETCM